MQTFTEETCGYIVTNKIKIKQYLFACKSPITTIQNNVYQKANEACCSVPHRLFHNQLVSIDILTTLLRQFTFVSWKIVVSRTRNTLQVVRGKSFTKWGISGWVAFIDRVPHLSSFTETSDFRVLYWILRKKVAKFMYKSRNSTC